MPSQAWYYALTCKDCWGTSGKAREEGEGSSDRSGRELESWEERKTKENTSSTSNPSGHHTIRPDVSPAHRFSHSIFTIFHYSDHFEFFTKVVPKTLICLGGQLSSPVHLICYTVCWWHQGTPSSKSWEFWKLEGVKIGRLSNTLGASRSCWTSSLRISQPFFTFI
jgi:hypothetical protein